jgi:hypothetical protein
MNTERIFKIVLTELSSDVLKLEEELESEINSSSEINEKVTRIKKLLSDIVTTEASIVKFTNMVSYNNNNEELKNEKQ